MKIAVMACLFAKWYMNVYSGQIIFWVASCFVFIALANHEA